MLKKICLFIFAGIMAASMVGCSKKGDKAPVDNEVSVGVDYQFAMPEKGEDIAVIKTNMGDITVRFFPNEAPKAVENFITHAKDGYYDGVIFHRVINDFMIQGGDPDGTGAGGPGYTIPDEFSNNLHFNKMGVLAMANRGPNTGGSQFFITLGPTDWLDNKHTIFGTVVQGMDVVEKIGKVKTGRNDKPVEPVIINSITLEPITDDAKNGK